MRTPIHEFVVAYSLLMESLSVSFVEHHVLYLVARHILYFVARLYLLWRVLFFVETHLAHATYAGGRKLNLRFETIRVPRCHVSYRVKHRLIVPTNL